jgi:hypothetical protein
MHRHECLMSPMKKVRKKKKEKILIFARCRLEKKTNLDFTLPSPASFLEAKSEEEAVMVDVVAHYSPPLTSVSPTYATWYRSAQRDADIRRQNDQLLVPLVSTDGSQTTTSQSETITDAGTTSTLQKDNLIPRRAQVPTSTTFNRAVEISLMEPVGSMSLSPANRDVVLAARKGLFILDLENPYDQPRFLPHLTTWVPADVQWNPHPARANWVASTVSLMSIQASGSVLT